ncbi:MAG: glycosyltransferase [Candidatus Verstraetearchaeota archaeon]|nr:glycosyltransferase [Candidatus Verstraetearchaeota archaeon]
MRILQAIPYFYPAWRFGGPVRVAYDISRKLADRGHLVTVYTTDIKDENSRGGTAFKKVDGVNVFYFRNLSIYFAKKKIFITPSLIPALKKNVRSFDIVHIHGNRTTLNPIFYHFLKKGSVPYVIQSHGGLPSIGLSKNLYDLFFGYRLLKDASKVVALTRIEAEQYRSMGVPKEKIVIIPNGIDLSEYDELPPKGSFKKKFNISEDRKIILYLGRIHKTKGIDLLVRAYAHLKNEMKCRDVVLVIAGPDDGYLSEAKALANSLGVYNSVMFTGFISSEDKLKALVDAEVFVTPSFYGFPMTFLEACTVGTPIVTTSLGDTLEWIDRNVGYVAQPTPRDLAEVIFRIISDDELRSRFSKNCTEIVKSEFAIEKVVEKIEKVYKDVVER